jgi:hypothetical protein
LRQHVRFDTFDAFPRLLEREERLMAPTGYPPRSRSPERCAAFTWAPTSIRSKLDEAHAPALKPVLQMTFTTGMSPISDLRERFFNDLGRPNPKPRYGVLA